MANYKYSFHEERGEFHGYVEDEMGNTIYEMHYPEYYEDDVTGELIESSNIFEDGFMKSTDDTEGLKEYLVSMKLMDDDDELLSEKEFEESFMSGGQTGAYGHGTTLLEKGGDTTEEELEEEESEENKEEEHVEELSEETYIPTDVLYEYASDRGIDIMDLTARDIEDNYIGSYRSREDFGERMVNEGIVGDLSNYLEMYDRDKEMFADEEAEARLDGMDDEDLVREADLEDEYDEVKERLERIDELTDEIEEIQSRMQELREQETETEEDAEEVSNEMSDLDSALEEKKTELDNLEDEDNDLESIIDRAREDARDNIYQEILDELNRDAVGYFTDNLEYDVSDLANHSLFTIDYDSIADDFEHDYLFIEGDDGDLYVFRNYKWGGKLEHGGSVEQGNFRMLLNQAKELKHHAEELEQVLRKRPRVDAWVVALSERASLALSDITHYLDGTIHDDKASDSDVLNINVPTYIRTLEYAREDAKSDVDLHKLTENALEVSDKEGVVEMDDYEEIVPKMASGGDVRKIKARNFGEQIENNRKFKELIQKVFDDQSGEHKYPIEFIQAIALTPHPIVKSEGKNYVKGYSYKGTISHFDFLDDANFVKALEYVDRPSIKKFASGGEMPTNLSWAKLKVGQLYDWKIGAEPLQVKYIGKTKDNPNKKAGSSIGKGFLFEWVDEPNKYVEVGLTSIPRVLANAGTFARGGVNLGASFEKLKGQMKEEEKEKKVDLFETPEKIPAKVQEVLDAFAEGIESGEYDVLQKAQEAVQAIGYTFDFDLDGTMSDLRKMGKSDSYAKGGEIKVGDLVKVKKYGWVMRVDKVEDDLYYLENNKIGKAISGKLGNPGSYSKSQLEKIDEDSYAKGGESTFQEKVTKIAKKNVGKAVPKSVQKDYGKRFSKSEALDSARRIVGSMKAKGYFK
jgi:hypothetical protein